MLLKEKSYNTFSLIIVIHQSNWTPLIWAAHSGQTGIVRLLLAAGADVEVKDIVSIRMLMCTCMCVFPLLSYCIINEDNHYIILQDIYQEYDDVIINNDATIFVFVLTIKRFVLILFFLYLKTSITNISLFFFCLFLFFSYSPLYESPLA